MDKLKPLLFFTLAIFMLVACQKDVHQAVQLSIFNQTPFTLRCSFTTVDPAPSGHKLTATIEPGSHEQIYATPELTDHPEELIGQVYQGMTITVNDTLELKFFQGEEPQNYALTPYRDQDAWMINERVESRPTNMRSEELYIYEYIFTIKEEMIR